MAYQARKPALNLADQLSSLPPERKEFDALIQAKVAEADANLAPGIPMNEVFEGLRKRHAEQAGRGT